uniref:Protein phosphatase 1 regulatory subunit 7 n=1 Tax=Globisporangium ultimum (strain ATCC 200006 / CBS 805.95 / DAOM BR144) TaxID=431595 RepID=K3WME8_GLOUD
MDVEGVADRAISRVNAGVHSVDEIAHDDDRDDAVEQLNLHGNCIESMNGLEAFSRLVELCLSNNFIQEISFAALEPLVHLKILDLSANRLLDFRHYHD